jgi:hypothetical protein
MRGDALLANRAQFSLANLEWAKYCSEELYLRR